MKYIFGLFILTLISCQNPDSRLTSEEILDKAIAYSGKSKLNNHQLEFVFRDYNYKATPTCEGMRLERSSRDEPIKDVLFNGELNRYYNDSLVKLADTTAFKYFESVNSVHYFTQLPLRLKDDAVQISNLGKEEIEDKTYHKLEVKFSEKGGGVDFEDIYIYWIDTEDYALDYLAYSFLVNGGGLRFRKAINRRTVNGVVFQDYKNYKPKVKSKNLEAIGKMYENQELELLSLIENESIKLSATALDCN
jgi:hypothetical protein